MYLSDYPAKPEVIIKALVALQLLVTFIFLFLGITGLGGKLANNLPNSLKGGILIGAGIAALLGENKIARFLSNVGIVPAFGEI